MDIPYVVVDGSNIATEARSLPSLQQLDEAVRSFLQQHTVEQITVIVDATFGHRIDGSEKEEYEAAIANAEIITPPAGTIGRGDAFILQVASRADATVLSNDSFQEFHAEHEWLFEEGRLIGGKPIPGVGWVFTPRTPVRGATSRRAVREAKQGRKGGGRSEAKGGARGEGGGSRSRKRSSSRKGSAEPANRERSGSRRGGAAKGGERAAKQEQEPASSSGGGSNRRRRTKGRGGSQEALNELLPFLDFVGANPPGTEIDATVDTYASHGAYAETGGVRCYIPLKSMGDPPPTKARDLIEVGSAYRFTVEGVDTPRRGIDLALVVVDGAAVLSESQPEPRATTEDEPASDSGGTRRRRRRRSSGASDEDRGANATTALDDVDTTYGADSTAEEAPVSPAKKAAKKSPAKKRATKKAAAKKTTAKKAAKKAPAKKTTAKRAAKKAPAKKRATKKAAAKKAPAKKRATKKAAAKKTTAKKAAKKAPAKKRATKKAAAKKTTAKKAAKKAPAKKATAKKAAKKRSTRR